MPSTNSAKENKLNFSLYLFGMSPDHSVSTSKRKYIQAILKSMKTQTDDSQDPLTNLLIEELHKIN